MTTTRQAAPRRGSSAGRRPPARKPSRKPPARASARKPAARAQRRAPDPVPPRGRGDQRRRRGRALTVAMVAVVALLVAMGLGPLRGYTTGAERVSELEAERNQLATEVDELEDRREALMDDDQVEIMAREQLGLIRPGEVPYTVVDPNEDTELVRPQLEEVSDQREAPWYERLARAVTRLFESDG